MAMLEEEHQDDRQRDDSRGSDQEVLPLLERVAKGGQRRQVEDDVVAEEAVRQMVHSLVTALEKESVAPAVDEEEVITELEDPVVAVLAVQGPVDQRARLLRGGAAVHRHVQPVEVEQPAVASGDAAGVVEGPKGSIPVVEVPLESFPISYRSCFVGGSMRSWILNVFCRNFVVTG